MSVCLREQGDAAVRLGVPAVVLRSRGNRSLPTALGICEVAVGELTGLCGLPSKDSLCGEVSVKDL
jgi:hypothetical protein